MASICLKNFSIDPLWIIQPHVALGTKPLHAIYSPLVYPLLDRYSRRSSSRLSPFDDPDYLPLDYLLSHFCAILLVNGPGLLNLPVFRRSSHLLRPRPGSVLAALPSCLNTDPSV
ncbi:hypothetical protein PGTUg99_032036 [Puccinia graminis f. sp. tritici]|uniref:Uncharacterized protein n=1 Tax=Puccinia graminis f. sp. tritici TaxID=56615 RepID=A0A5B0PP29_PUCGR|nr:hypothetical protein PGTUg99_032036 [Puccinia graminis f. sp. tritici]